MIHKKQLLLIFLALLTLPALAQQQLKFSIANFEADPFDMSPKNKQYEKIDGSGARYAIIKVTSDNPDDDLRAFNFNFGNLRHEVVAYDGELWVYVQKNAKMVTIRRDGYNPINKYALPVTIEEGKAYKMFLSVQTPEVKHRILQFRVTPANEGAIVKVKREGENGDFELWGTVDATGSIAKRMETGIYLYEVTAEHYEKTVGKVVLTYADDNYMETVTLKPNFGHLEVADEYGIAGAEIYVNDKKIGTVPYTSKDRWDVRDDYRIMISNGELYKTYNATFAIHKGETTRLTPKLESNFAETTITVANNAEILIEGVSKGHGTWTGPLKAGTYNVECRIDNRYRPTRKQIAIKPDVTETFEMDAPTPIIGSIFVNSNPLGASIQLDGKDVGKTPHEIKEVIIGKHTLRILLDGYRAEEQTVDVTEGKTVEKEFRLRDEARFTINSEPQARLTLNGEDKGMTPYRFDGASGDYDIRLTRNKYKSYHQKITLLSSAPEQTFQLQRQFQQPTSGYVQAAFQVGTLMGASTHVGTYIYNVNVEAFGMMGLSKETIYLNYTDETASKAENLKATLIGGKVGYGFAIGSRLRITPQVGLGALNVKSDGITANALSTTIGCRVDYAITSFLGINLTPEGQFAVSKKDVFTQLSELSSKVKSWGTGAGVRLGIYFFF